jgi:type I restriction-modification system DNA methylase subunit/predicted type IV restriction endonuclease
MITKQEAYAKISELVTRFEEQIDAYKQTDYNETLTRRDFIDPFFKALGWDVDNSQGYAEAYREVIHEDRVKIGKATKAPDYSFRLPGGKRLFFVEAKKPSVAIKDDISVAYQIRRYGWSAKLPVSIITDFEEFAVYDCTKRPKPTDKPGIARIKYIRYKNYLDEFEYLWNTFSKERVLKGSFDRYIQSDTVKKGTATVDKEFLASLDTWRTYLATSISLRNKELDEDEINYMVQLTIDRLIFLRIAEDRGVEPYGQLKISATRKGDAYQNLFFNFKKADEKYNSGLFDFKQDKISESLKIDNKVVKTIVKEMYYPECPYEFSVLPVEILGNAYEQFLGKVIRITPAHHAKIEEKPEVRKAGGVYYTPQYVVDYILKNTVGKLIYGKTPKQISNLKICDPACGSGSFLIGAYQYLLDYHKDYYTSNGTQTGKRNSPVTPDGNLTSAEKKRILLNNIYGVDIDVNAVEVTKLSLLLKCMEGETETTIAQQQKLWHERILPNLGDNIKSGNSLVDTDFYDAVLDFGEEKKIKPFNWQRAFPEVFENGGFDAVIGNPPWGADFSQDLLSYLRERNMEIIVRMIDSFMYFAFKSYKLIKDGGRFGMILPDVLFYQTDNEKLRKFILNHSSIQALLNLGDVFEGVIRPSCIIIFSKLPPNKSNRIITVDITDYKRDNKHIELYNKENYQGILQQDIREIPNLLFVTKNANHFKIINKIKNRKIKKLSEFVDEDGIQRGVSPDLKDAFIVTSGQIDKYNLEKSHLRKVLTGGKQVKRFHILYPDLQLIYTNKQTDFKRIPNICNFINQFKSKITCKEVKQGKHPIYALHRAREEKIFTKPEKLIGVITEDEIVISLDNKQTYTTDGLYLFSVKNIDAKFLMGILNSKLFVFLYRLTTMEKGRTLAQVKPTIVAEMPIKVIDENIKSEKLIQEEIIRNVNSLLDLYPKVFESRLKNQTEQLQSRIDHHIFRIDQLVYELYGLTDEEIALVEGE